MTRQELAQEDEAGGATRAVAQFIDADFRRRLAERHHLKHEIALMREERDLSQARAERLAEQVRALNGDLCKMRMRAVAAELGATAARARASARTGPNAAPALSWGDGALDALPQEIALFDQNGGLAFANAALRARFTAGALTPGMTTGALMRAIAGDGAGELNSPASDEAHPSASDDGAGAPLAASAPYPALERGSPEGDAVDNAVNIVRPDGSTLRLRFRRLAQPQGWLALICDPEGESARREAELGLARRQAEAASRAKSAFLAHMSHAFRTPLNGVFGMLDVLCGGALSAEQRVAADVLRASTEALLKAMDEILDYSRLETRRLTLNPAPFDLERTLDEAAALHGPFAASKGLSLQVAAAQDAPTRFIGDAGRVRQLASHLIENAIRFTDAGCVRARLSAEAQGNGVWRAILDVADTGPGIPHSARERVFEEFVQLGDAAARGAGPGLGLSLARELAKIMGGEIRVETAAEGGARLIASLPLACAEDPAEAGRPAPRAPVSRAMVICDAPLERTALTRRLADCGLDAGAPLDAAAAMRGLPLDAIDLLIVDADDADAAGLDLDALAEAATARGARFVVIAGPDRALSAQARRLPRQSSRADVYRMAAALWPSGVARPAQDVGPPRMRVLAADDNKTNQLVLAGMTKSFDIDLRIVPDGEAAVAEWRRFAPHLVFMDISMPGGMDGIAAIRAIRAEEQARGCGATPICALTAHAAPEDMKGALAAGADRFLTKPLRRADLADAIAACRPKVDPMEGRPDDGATPLDRPPARPPTGAGG